MIPTLVEDMKNATASFGNPYHEYVPGLLCSADNGATHHIWVPVEIGRDVSMDNLHYTTWFLTDSFEWHQQNKRVVCSGNMIYSAFFTDQSQDGNVPWAHGRLRGKWTGDIIIVSMSASGRFTAFPKYVGSLLRAIEEALLATKTVTTSAIEPCALKLEWSIDGAPSATTFIVSYLTILGTKTSYAGHEQAEQAEIRVTTAISIFFDPLAIDLVFQRIASFSGCIVGSLPSWLMGQAIDTLPTELHIIVAKGHALEAVRFFQDELFVRSVIRNRYELVSRTDGDDIEPNVFDLRNTLAGIILYESHSPDVMETIVCMSDTSYMNILTGTELISLYPNFTTNHIRYINLWHHGREVESHWDGVPNIKGPFFIHSSMSMNRPCGAECPILWRRLCETQQISWFEWRGSSRKFSDYRFSKGFEESDIRWRIDHVCANKFCETASSRGKM
ncbi:hypothetical protein C8J56DRAFT_901487 [Mycena floridula]|nr:hypothetical protein C8J56DRAFT_901487 [Mycena floridula]